MVEKKDGSKTDVPAAEGFYGFACNDSLGEGAKTNERDSTEYNRLLEEARTAPGVLWGYEGKIPSVKPIISSYRSPSLSKSFWVMLGTMGALLAVGVALLLESSYKKNDDKPKTEYHSPAYSPTSPALTPQEAYLKDGTSYKFYIIDNKVAVTELGGKPVIDSLEGKLGK